MTDTTDHDRQHIAQPANRAWVATLTTATSQGKQVGRPIAPQKAEFDGDLWFFADDRSATAAQIQVAPAEQRYSPFFKARFPDGLPPELTLIRVNTGSAEHREAPTSNVAWSAGTARTMVTRNPVNDPIDNDTVAW